MKRWLVGISSGLTVLAVSIVAAVGVLRTHHTSPLLPATVTKDISFITYLPPRSWQVDTTDARYNSGVLAYKATSAGTTLSVTEQATPDIFNDVPDYYPALISRLNSYATIGTANGTMYLTTPSELQGGQQAVLNNDGTFLFAHPSRPLSNDQWRRLFDNLQVIKPA